MTLNFEDVSPLQQFTPIQVGNLLGIHADTVKKLAAAGELEGITISAKRFWRFSAQNIMDYITRQRAKAAAKAGKVAHA